MASVLLITVNEILREGTPGCGNSHNQTLDQI